MTNASFPPRLLNLAQSNAAFRTLFVVSALVALYPLWSVTYPPLVDLGGHIELMDIAAHLREAPYSEHFELKGYGGPNTITLLMASIFGRAVGALTLSRVLLSWYVVGLPLSFGYFCRCFQRSRWLVFFAFPLAWNHMLNFGFLNYLVALPFFFLIAGRLRVALDEMEAARLRAAVLVGAGLTLTFYCHFLVWLMTLGYAIYLFAWFGTSRNLLVRVVLTFGPSVAFGGRWAWLQNGREAVSTDPAWGGSGATRYKPLEDMLGDLYQGGLRFIEGRSDERTAIALLLSWSWLMLWRSSTTEATTRSARARWRESAVELSAIGALACYFLLPENFGGVNVVAARTLPVLFLLFVASVRWGRGDRRPFPAIATAVVLSISYPFTLAKYFQRFEREVVADLPKALRDLPRHAALGYSDESCPDWKYNNPFIELCVNYHLPRAVHSHLNHGFTSHSFAGAPTSAITWRAGRAIPPPAPQQPAKEPSYVLIRREAAPEAYRNLPYAVPLYEGAGWWLYRLEPRSPR